jgi:RNase P subunit RPR2
MDYLLCCHHCEEVIVKDAGSMAKIRGRVILIKGENIFAVCKGCGAEIRVPLQLDLALMKSLRSNPKLFITKKSNKY